MYATVCAACLVFSIRVVQCIGTLLLYHYLLKVRTSKDGESPTMWPRPACSPPAAPAYLALASWAPL